MVSVRTPDTGSWKRARGPGVSVDMGRIWVVEKPGWTGGQPGKLWIHTMATRVNKVWLKEKMDMMNNTPPGSHRISRK
jgi:hypothetical protein